MADLDREFADDEANAANNKYAACCIHEDESGSLTGPPRRQSVPPLMIGSVASRSLLSGSSTREAEVAQLPEEEANDPIRPALVRRRIQEESPTSSAMHPSPAEVRR